MGEINLTELSARVLAEVFSKMPEVIARSEVPKLLGGMISKGYLQNLDSEGKGPRRIKIGKRAGYLRSDLQKWIMSRLKIIESTGGGGE